jgi:hypothetical protein
MENANKKHSSTLTEVLQRLTWRAATVANERVFFAVEHSTVQIAFC